MKVNRIDHISIAVRDLAAACRSWEPVLGSRATRSSGTRARSGIANSPSSIRADSTAAGPDR